MVYSSKEKEIEYRKMYYQKNKEIIALKNKAYYQEHSKVIRLKTKKYKEDHRIETQNYNKSYHKKYLHLNKNKIKIKHKKYYMTLKLKIVDFYSKGKMCCECCGESVIDFLTIDHIDNNGNVHRKEIGEGSERLYSWLIKNNFPKGFQVSCFNCNCGRSTQTDKVCPHEKLLYHNRARFIHPRGDTGEAKCSTFEEPMTESKLLDYNKMVIRIVDVSKSGSR